MRAALVLLLLVGLSATAGCGRKGALEPPAGTAQDVDAGQAQNGKAPGSWNDEEDQWPPPLPEGRDRHMR